MSLPEPGREPFLSSADGIAGRLRATPEDFAVVERELLPPEAADGRHTSLWRRDAAALCR